MLNKVGFRVIFPAFLLSIMTFQAFMKETQAESITIPKAINLQKDGLLAQQQGIPVLLEFSMHGCSFCEQIESEVLRPMLISGDYDKKVMLRKVMIDEDTVITDFNGKKITYDELASRYKIYVTPTLILLHGNGKAMGIEMVGVTTIDFYGAYLDQAIDDALKQTSIAAERTNGGSPAS
ncbi:MAG: thioredoxin fold domain-containing protein [Gammaproteobacteria bacterium]|nr:thioredoxin fold domain-containing protein [Gammaproteobacteria bacterium]